MYDASAPAPTLQVCHFESQDLDVDSEAGGVIIEYGVLIATIVLLLTTVGATLVPAVQGWFLALAGRLAAL